MKPYSTYKVEAEYDGMILEDYLKQILQYSGRKIQKLTRKKGIFLNGKHAYLQRKVKSSDTVRVLILEDDSYGVQPERGDIDLLYEDEYMFVINKPAYQLVHPTGRTSTGTLANYLAYFLKERGELFTVRPIHRLDRETSGCVVFAKDARSQLLLEQQLKTGELERTYQAIALGIVNPAAGTINTPIGPHPTLPNRRAADSTGDTAVTHYRTIKIFPAASLLELNLETGRTHQIRVHLSHIGHPILGDRMYGVRSALISRQALHAVSITFRDLKDKRERTVHAPLPADFANALSALS